ncbi:MAG: hypothetical protein VKJ05_02555 [Synechococcaceae cyanobacterium]|nr:hypothetical protein [Synechococcaceae cyanobacterium]
MLLIDRFAGLARSPRLPVLPRLPVRPGGGRGLPAPGRVAVAAALAPEQPCWRREALLAFLHDHLPPRPSILDTAPGAFTLDLLRLEPRELVAVGADAGIWQALRASAERRGLCLRPLQEHHDAPRWVLPRLSASVRERQGRFDLVRLGQCEAWPSACLELAHAGALLRRGGFLLIDNLLPAAGRKGSQPRTEPPGYRLFLEFGSGLVFEKISHLASLHEWERPLAKVLPARLPA